MNKRYKDRSGRTIKWKHTRWGKKHYARLRFIQKAMLHGVSMSAMGEIERIRCAPAKTPEMKLKKAVAIAEAVIASNARILKTVNITRQWFA